MIFRQLFDAESSTYTYLLADSLTREAMLIDSVREQADRDVKLIEELGLKLVRVFDTHVHADHVTGASTLRDRTGAKSVVGGRAAPCADLHVAHGDVLQVGSLEIDVLATPGHTDESVSYRVGDRVFTGDAMLVRGNGRTDFQNGDAATLYDSITCVLFALPDETLVYPAHDYHGHTVTTIGEEKRCNPRIAGKTRDEFVAIMARLNLPAPRKLLEAVPANQACGAVVRSPAGASPPPQGVPS